MKKLAWIVALPALCFTAPAFAHFTLQSPTPNTTSTDGGMGSPPCGVGTASNVVTPAQGGHTITLKIDEFVPHTGFYRVALALNSPSELPVDNVVKDSKGNILPPSGKPSGTSASAEYEDPPVFPVLQDHLFQHDGTGEQVFQMDLTLPNVTCEKCTLQVIEFMQGHPFNTASPPDTGPGGGYFYHHCADLKITADPALPPFGGGGAGGGGAGAGAGGGGASAGGASALGGASSSAGAGGVAGAAAGASGSSATASAGQGGSPGSGGAMPTGGTGVTGSAGTSAVSPASSPSQDSGGCSCAFVKQRSSYELGTLLGDLAALVLARRRRQRQ